MTMRKPLHSHILWQHLPIALIATTVLGSIYTLTPEAIAAPYQISQQSQDWQTALDVVRLVNASQEVTDLVVQLNVLNKPDTSYANTVYEVFALIDGQWQGIYTNTGARLITSQAGSVTLEPEVIPITALQERLDQEGLNLSEVDLRVVAQVRYDVRGGRRDQVVETVQTQSYSLIAQTTTIDGIVGIVEQTETSRESGIFNRPGGRIGLPEIQEGGVSNRPSAITGLPELPSPDSTTGSVAGDDVVTLSNGYRVTFLGVSYTGQSSTWRYYVEELPVAQDLSNWVLELPSCARIVDASPRGELVNPDPNARLSGIKWQPGGGFVEGEFSVTLSGSLTVGCTTVAVKGPDVAFGDLAGPACSI